MLRQPLQNNLNNEQHTSPVMQVKNLKKYFPINSPFGRKIGDVKAVDGISFDLFERETFGLVGESGCGKSTAGRTILGLAEATGGSSIYKGEDIFKMKKKELHLLRKDIQMIFQDPDSSLNPKQRIGDAIIEPMRIHGIGTKKDRKERAINLLKRTGLREDQFYRYPHEFSGGQRQRIGLARALAVDPKLIVCDEPVSALDVSIQSQVINLLEDVQEEFGLAYLFIAHDLSVVRHIADNIGVMYLGHIVELTETDKLFANPLHPYTEILLSSVPIPDPTVKRERITIEGDVPSPSNPPSGCVFRTRCPKVMDICSKKRPVLKEQSAGQFVACHLYE